MSSEVKTDNEAAALVEELSSYIYGFLVLAGLASFMLLIHIMLSVFFHN
ncbi:MAG: hypothetical protein ACW98K_02555 [Candidatus Kariarchaeaceae archaeon]|jgi:hypothetical protein